MKGRRGKMRFPVNRWRRRRRDTLLPFLLLCLVTAGAWAVQMDVRSEAPEVAKPSVLRGGDAWQGGGAHKRQGRGNDVLSGLVTHVRDGDTIEVSGTAVRIANLDCAERGTSEGDRATQRLRDLALHGSMRCQLSGRQSFDRAIGTCVLSNGQDVGERLIAEGLCTRWR